MNFPLNVLCTYQYIKEAAQYLMSYARRIESSSLWHERQRVLRFSPIFLVFCRYIFFLFTFRKKQKMNFSRKEKEK